MRPPPILAALLVAIAALCGTHAAEALQPLGCVSAHIGKWHMRGDPGEHGYTLHDGDTSNTPGNTIADEAKQRPPSDPGPSRVGSRWDEKANSWKSLNSANTTSTP